MMGEVILNKRKKLAIIDGGLIFKWYFAIPNLVAEDKTPIGAVYGFIKMLLKLINNYDFFIVAIDGAGPTFRHAIYSDYKNNRTQAPDNLKTQFPIALRALEALNIPSCHLDGYEADDIIATYTAAADKDGIEVHIVSSDKDLMQLVNENVFIYDTSSQRLLGKDHVVKKFEVPPEYIIDYLSLLGDAVDAIPGVKGIGKKGAIELIGQFGHIEQIYSQIDFVRSKRLKEALINGREDAFMSQKLAALHIIPNILPLQNMQFTGFDANKIDDFNSTYKLNFLTRLSHSVRTNGNYSKIKQEKNNYDGSFDDSNARQGELF